MRPYILLLACAVSAPLAAQPKLPAAPRPAAAAPVAAADTSPASKLAGNFRFRSIGPALTSGRIADVVVDPTNSATWYVASAAGGVWKSVNGGLSFTPIFDSEGAYSIGAIALDPKNPNVVWVGTGENNAQRVVAYGDGVYKSIDGGRSWKNVGLKTSEHIGRIVIDPRNPDVVYVAAQGPLSVKGGERGVYKTTDGGATWTRSLQVDDWTGANDIQIDPRNPDVLVATMWQRQRRTCCFVAGGPGSGVYRSIDAGKTWTKSQSGFPSGDIGRIGLAMSPANPSVVYAIADAAAEKGGMFRSRDGGVSWERMSGFQSGGNYYNEIFADPKDVDRVYAVDMLLQVSTDGGRTFQRVGERLKHVDNHSVWIDPANTEHLIVGCDGGVYESHDRGKSWRFVANLPVTQFYRVFVDDVQPFYRVFGGAQDNFSMGGPSRTRTINGIRNADWFITSGGDGFGSAVDPDNSNIVYAQSQFGVLSRFNLATGDVAGIQPEDAANGPGLRWNWDSPLIVSAHAKGRIYFAAERVMRSDDRGNSWRAVSGDLSRNVDRTRIRMFDRVQGVDAVARNASTTLFGNITSIAESPVRETILATGSNDGRIGVTEDGGTTWRTIDHIAGVPDTSYVSRVALSKHNANVLYATFNNYLNGDYAPYVLKSTDLGRTFTNIAGNLPARGAVWAIVEDPVNANLLFVGTDGGVYFTVDGGARWVALKSGLPATVQVRDLAIQPRHNDLVLATFGRGFYILDDYSPLRTLTPQVIASTAHIFAPRVAHLYAQTAPLGLPGGVFQGAGHYFAENPPFGATFQYYLKDALKSRKSVRQDADAAATKKNADATFPSWDALKAEDREEDPAVLLEVRDAGGRAVRRVPASASAGINRVTWDLRYEPADPVTGPAYQVDPDNPFSGPPIGPWALPGEYTAQLYTRVDGVLTPIGAAAKFTVTDVDASTRSTPRTAESLAFDLAALDLQRAVLALASSVGETQNRLRFLQRAVDASPRADSALVRQARTVMTALRDAQELLSGDPTRARRNEHTPPSLMGRLLNATGNAWGGTLEPMTAAQRAQVEIVRSEFSRVQTQVRTLLDTDVKNLEAAADRAGIPWTGGRRP
jgi:photosystem II stability/assembly factor-like uncharacterized protein